MKTTRKTGLWMMLCGLSFAILPILIVLISMIPASIGDCHVDESAIHPCIIFGVDIGGLLSLSFMTGWLALFTIPVGGAVAVIGLVTYLIALVFRFKRHSIK